MSKFRRSSAAAPAGRYLTPRSAKGISAMMISALKTTAERIADCGVASLMTFSTLSCGKAPANIAGIIAKYLARSEEHTSELQSQSNLVCRLLLEKKKIQPAHLVEYV